MTTIQKGHIGLNRFSVAYSIAQRLSDGIANLKFVLTKC